MNAEFFEAVEDIEAEKGIPRAYMYDKIKQAMLAAFRRDNPECEDNVEIILDEDKKRIEMNVNKTIVDQVEDPSHEIILDSAKKISRRAKVGDTIGVPVETKKFGRIAAQAAKQVIIQGIREAERERIMAEYQSHCNDIITATVLRTDPRTGNVTLELANRNEAILPKNEQVPGETYTDGQRIRVYVMDVFAGDKGPRMKISRTRAGLVERLFEMEVPEIYDGTIEIKATAREAGPRTKLAGRPKDPNGDAVGACVGPKGSRVAGIVDELGGEKIDVVKYSEDIQEFIAAALAPATVLGVEIEDEEARSCKVTVPDHQLSLAIGNKGQNARLAAKLTGWKIDIRPESGFYGEE